MGKRKREKRQIRRPVVLRQDTTQSAVGNPREKSKAWWRQVPKWAWTTLSAIALLVGLFALYPSLSINEDYSFDNIFPYNSSFSITNEGFWPISDLSAVCSAEFTMRPWPARDGSTNESQMHLRTTDDAHKDFTKLLKYKQRVTLPCNHNVVANGHLIDPGATLNIIVTYRFYGTGIRRSQIFNLRTVAGWNGQSFWQYDD